MSVDSGSAIITSLTDCKQEVTEKEYHSEDVFKVKKGRNKKL